MYFVDSQRKTIGTGFFVGPRVAISTAHTFNESMIVGTKRTGYFGKPHTGRTCNLVVDWIDRENDFIIFAIEGEDAPKYLEPAPVSLDECILVAYQLGIHDELERAKCGCFSRRNYESTGTPFCLQRSLLCL